MEELKLIGEKIEKFKYILAEHIELFEEEEFPFNLEVSKEVRAQLIQLHADALIHGKAQAMESMKKTGMEIGKQIVDRVFPWINILRKYSWFVIFSGVLLKKK